MFLFKNIFISSKIELYLIVSYQNMSKKARKNNSPLVNLNKRSGNAEFCQGGFSNLNEKNLSNQLVNARKRCDLQFNDCGAHLFLKLPLKSYQHSGTIMFRIAHIYTSCVRNFDFIQRQPSLRVQVNRPLVNPYTSPKKLQFSGILTNTNLSYSFST